jgi:hypothetical protein
MSLDESVFGVWSLRVLDSFIAMNSAVPSASVHGDSDLPQLHESFLEQVLALRHRSHDQRERFEVLLLAAEEGLRFEERNDLRQKIVPVANHEHQRGVARSAVVLAYPSAAEPPSDQVEDLTSFRILADVELGHELPSGSRAGVPLNGDVKRTFSVYEARDVGIQPSLLIVRTRRIVTAHAFDDTDRL